MNQCPDKSPLFGLVFYLAKEFPGNKTYLHFLHSECGCLVYLPQDESTYFEDYSRLM